MRVLVVEDDERLSEVFREFLEELGHEPLIAHSAESALVKLRAELPGAVLLDIRLPGMSGFDFLRLQTTRDLGVPIVVVSGMLTEDEALECLRLGAVDFLRKPLPLDRLREVLACLEPLTPGKSRVAEPRRGSDRRRAPRAAVAMPVHVSEYGGATWDATAVDVSSRGIKLRTAATETVSPSAAAKLSFTLPEGRGRMEVASVLVRADIDGVAFHFVNLADWQLEQLNEFVRRSIDAPPPPEPHLRVLRSITQAVSRSLDVDEMLRLALHALTTVTGHEISSLHLLSNDGRTLQLRGERGMSAELRAINKTLPVGQGLIGGVVTTGRPARLTDVSVSPDLWSAARPVVEQEGTRGFVCVPLQSRGRVVGALSLGRRTSDPFTDAEVTLLEAAANQIGLALDNARLYDETRRQLDELEQADDLANEDRRTTVGRLAAGLVHEINNPLTAILGQAEILMTETGRSPASRERLRVILEETSRAARLLKSVLQVSRPRRAERRPCLLETEVGSVLQLTGPELEWAGIRVITDFEEVPPVWADGDQIRQVLLNLVQNARQAMAAHSGERVLTARTRLAGGRSSVEILDTGPGIPNDVLPRIFDAFFTTKAPGEGTGLGLWVSHDIAERHGGRLTAENRPSGGAAFTLELPQRR